MQLDGYLFIGLLGKDQELSEDSAAYVTSRAGMHNPRAGFGSFLWWVLPQETTFLINLKAN